jgi:large subunit ribosomal protein L33
VVLYWIAVALATMLGVRREAAEIEGHARQDLSSNARPAAMVRTSDTPSDHDRGTPMAKGKEARTTVKLQSTESSYCYFTEKNKNNTKERLQLRKYDPIVRKHVLFKETGKL